MKNRALFVLGGLLLAVLLATCKTEKPPNFLFILVDDLGWMDLACYGSQLHQTPNLDQLAAEGVVFTDAYASCPVCSPTRASIMTGKYPSTLNITDWIPGLDPKDRKLLGTKDLHALPQSETTIAEALRAGGYQTFFAGKWHLGGEGSHPEDHGFDINKGGHDRGSPPGGYYSPYKNPKLQDGPDDEYLPDRLTNESISFLRQVEDPFLLYLSYYTVHTPIQASRRHVEGAESRARELGVLGQSKMVTEHDGSTVTQQYNADYASMVTAMDENVGRILDELERLKLNKNTIVIFTSDNGGLSTLYANRRSAPTSVRPLRGGKGWCYEGGIRVPLIIRATDQLKPGRCEEPVTSIDFYPTMLDLAGISKSESQHVDGISLTPLLRTDQQLDREAIFWHYPHYHGSAWTPGAAIRMGDWKLIEFFDYEKSELYNLKSDLGEMNDLSSTHSEIKETLKAKLKEMQNKTGAQYPDINPGFGTVE